MGLETSGGIGREHLVKGVSLRKEVGDGVGGGEIHREKVFHVVVVVVRGEGGT